MVHNGKPTERPLTSEEASLSSSSSPEIPDPAQAEPALDPRAKARAMRPPPVANAFRRTVNPYIDMLDEVPETVVSFMDAYQWRGRWQERYPSVQPLYLELGSGYGHFLTERARQHPEQNFLGLELKYKRLYRSALKVKHLQLTNAQFVRFDALQLDEAFAPGELSGAFISYPDPWPKKSHNIKRMVCKETVALLEKLLIPGATVQLRSDWEPYRQIFPETFEGSRFVQTDYVARLDDWDREEANISSSFEKRFRMQGIACFFYEYTLQP